MNELFTVTPDILACLRATSHVRGWGESWTHFSERVQITAEQVRTWSRQRIADHAQCTDRAEFFKNQKRKGELEK